MRRPALLAGEAAGGHAPLPFTTLVLVDATGSPAAVAESLSELLDAAGPGALAPRFRVVARAPRPLWLPVITGPEDLLHGFPSTADYDLAAERRRLVDDAWCWVAGLRHELDRAGITASAKVATGDLRSVLRRELGLLAGPAAAGTLEAVVIAPRWRRLPGPLRRLAERQLERGLGRRRPTGGVRCRLLA